jgi:hypothetical protein
MMGILSVEGRFSTCWWYYVLVCVIFSKIHVIIKFFDLRSLPENLQLEKSKTLHGTACCTLRAHSCNDMALHAPARSLHGTARSRTVLASRTSQHAPCTLLHGTARCECCFICHFNNFMALDIGGKSEKARAAERRCVIIIIFLPFWLIYLSFGRDLESRTRHKTPLKDRLLYVYIYCDMIYT